MNETLAAACIYAALNNVVFFWLANETGKIRRAERIAMGDGDNKHIARLMRGSANAAENIPMFTLCLVLSALIGAPAWLVHVFGMVFLGGRITHGFYFVRPNTTIKFRFVGFGIALLSHVMLVVGLLAHAIFALF